MNKDDSNSANFLQEFILLEKKLTEQVNQILKNNEKNNLLMNNQIKIDKQLENIINNLPDPVEKWIAEQNTESKQSKMIKKFATIIKNLQTTREKQLVEQVNQLLLKRDNDVKNLQKETTIKEKVINFFARPHDNWKLTTANTAGEAVMLATKKFEEKYGKDIASHVDIQLWYKPHLNRKLALYSDSWHLTVQVDGIEISNADRKKAIKLFLENTTN